MLDWTSTRKYVTEPQLDEKGTVVKQAKITNNHEAFDEFMEGLEKVRVVIEAGFCWQPPYDWLEEAGHDIRLAHSKEVKTMTKKSVRRIITVTYLFMDIQLNKHQTASPPT